jgi:hypothetical protein
MKMWGTVEEFFRWYQGNDFPIRPPFEEAVVVTDTSYSYVLYRHGRFQVTLYLEAGGTAATIGPLRRGQTDRMIAPLLGDTAFLSIEKLPEQIGSSSAALAGGNSTRSPAKARRNWDSLEEFARWYAESGFPFRIPAGDPIYKTDNSRSLVLYREGQFQAELYLIKPNTSSPEHSHPGTESLIVPWGGEFDATQDGEFKDASDYWKGASAQGTSRMFGVISTRLEDSHTHALHAYAKGAAFLSIEKWRPGLEVNSVTINWNGDPVDEDHRRSIQSIERQQAMRDA